MKPSGNIGWIWVDIKFSIGIFDLISFKEYGRAKLCTHAKGRFEFFLVFLIRKCSIPKLKTIVDKLNLCSNAITENKNANKTFVWWSGRHMNVLCTSNLGWVSTGKNLHFGLTLKDQRDFHEFHLTYFSPVLPLRRNQLINLLWKSMDQFLYNGNTGTYGSCLFFSKYLRLKLFEETSFTF